MVRERLDGVCADSSSEYEPWGVIKSSGFSSPGDAVKICLVDSGLESNHEDLDSSTRPGSLSGYSSVDGDWDEDSYGQGTHSAGTMWAIDDNGMGVSSIYDSANLHVEKILDTKGRTTSVYIMAAVHNCIEAGAKVISLNVGGRSSPSRVEARFFETIYTENEVLIFAPAGNSGLPLKSFPASYPHVISVAAVDLYGKRASFSQFNAQVEISGPGVDICSTHSGGIEKYRSFSGTSMATSHVAAAAALVWADHDGCSNDQVRASLLLAAADKPEF